MSSKIGPPANIGNLFYPDFTHMEKYFEQTIFIWLNFNIDASSVSVLH